MVGRDNCRRPQRLIALDDRSLTFRWKDYRASGRTRQKTMTLEPQEFMRRFLLHVLPGGFHRIRYCGLLANPVRRQNLATIRTLLHAPTIIEASEDVSPHATAPTFVCPALRRTDGHHRYPAAQPADSRAAWGQR
ncbi:hypothetical protein OKW43_004285 [Paraburkholderia sp. WC7.3g]